MQAKLTVFGSHLKGKMPANAIALGPRIRAFAKSPQKGPRQTVAVKIHEWTSVDVQMPLFDDVFGVL